MELLPTLLSTLRSVDPGALEHEYNVLRSMTKKDMGLTTEAGALKENTKKNRYKDILPYDQSRVVLCLQTSDQDSDYINASFIKGATEHTTYIACQAPLSSTLLDFWRMIWQYKVKVIIMACREIEMGKKKCECYWAAAHQSVTFGPFTVYNQGETHPNEDLMVRTLTVTYQQTSRTLIQYQFLSWPDHDVPYEAAGVLDLLQRAKNSQETHTSPLLVHCSAGCGRTGVICALDYIHDLLVTKRITADFSIMNVVLELRKQRPSAVQTKAQYQFIFTAATLMLERALQGPQQLYSNLPELKIPEKRTSQTSSPSKRNGAEREGTAEERGELGEEEEEEEEGRLQQPDMSDTYAVVNKPKQSQPAYINPAYSNVAIPQSNSASRTAPTSHHYDNEPRGAAASPVYSTVKPRAKPPTAHIYDTASANRRLGEGPPSLSSSTEYHLTPADNLPAVDDDYEDFSSEADAASLCSPGGIGFNCRIQKPRGPRDPPAEWSRQER